MLLISSRSEASPAVTSLDAKGTMSSSQAMTSFDNDALVRLVAASCPGSGAAHLPPSFLVAGAGGQRPRVRWQVFARVLTRPDQEGLLTEGLRIGFSNDAERIGLVGHRRPTETSAATGRRARGRFAPTWRPTREAPPRPPSRRRSAGSAARSRSVRHPGARADDGAPTQRPPRATGESPPGRNTPS